MTLGMLKGKNLINKHKRKKRKEKKGKKAFELWNKRFGFQFLAD